MMPIGSTNDSDSRTSGSDSDSSRDGGGGEQTPVVVKGRWGTNQVMPGVECEETGDEADGVMIVEREIEDNGSTYEKGVPLKEEIWTGMCETQDVDEMDEVRWETFK